MFDSKLTTRSAWNGQATSMNASCAPGFVPIPCPSHPQYSITNICKSVNCVQPLCPQCISDHVQLHQESKKPPKIQNIITTRMACIEQLAKMKYQANKEIQDAGKNSAGNIQEFVESQRKKLQIAYRKINKLIEDLFTEMDRQMQVITSAYISQKQKRQKQSKLKLTPMTDFLSRITQYKQQLQSDDYIPALLQLLHEAPRKPKLQPLSQLQNYGSVQINQKYFQDIKNDINKFVQVVVKCKDQGLRGRIQANVNKSAVGGSNNMRFSRFDRSKSKDGRDKDNSQSKISDSRRSNSRKKIFGCESVISDIKPMPGSLSRIQMCNSAYQNIVQPEQTPLVRKQYSLPQSYPSSSSSSSSLRSVVKQLKYSSSTHQPSSLIISKPYLTNISSSLWYFKQNTKLAFRAPLQSIQAGFERVQLAINFIIPEGHRTVILPTGNVVMLGGEQTGNTRNNVYVLQDLGQGFTLKEIAKMNQNRAHFGVAYHQDYIYVAGGICSDQNYNNKWGNKKVLNQCQRYSLRQNKWERLAPLSQPSFDFTMHAFNSGRIIKFGGLTQSCIFLNKIDIYDVYSNIWTSYQPDNRFIMTYSPGVTQISNQSLVVFGGRSALKNQKISKCYILTEDENNNCVTISQGPQLYSQATFQNAFTYENTIVAIQNNETSNRNKLIMGYKYQQWKFIAC